MTCQAWKKKIYNSRSSHVCHYPCKPWSVLLNPYFPFFLFKFIQTLLILQLDVFLNRTTKQKTEPEYCDILSFLSKRVIGHSEYNAINHTVNFNIIELLWCTVETLSSMQYTPLGIYLISGALASLKFWSDFSLLVFKSQFRCWS